MSVAELGQFLLDAFPDAPPPYLVSRVERGVVELRLPVVAAHGRPGGTVSGPALMALADCAAYLGVVAEIGPVALAVTTSLHIDFLRKPPMEDVTATSTLIKLGRRLAVADVELRSTAPLEEPGQSGPPERRAFGGPPDLVAKAQVTYSIPPVRP
ncbi:MAG: PaaI family thioesterase [Actinomycetota bacterium]|jgi:uncharacterized protein (TIGR00369 family)|nr:PaaI family thioesterase [Actinomycetota bacterium]